jgi:hypothetical protein
VQREPHKNSGELMCTGRVNNFCSSTSGTRHVTSVTNPVVNSCVPEGWIVSAPLLVLLTFHLYAATFQQHLHMEYKSLSWDDISDLVISLQFLLSRYHWYRVTDGKLTMGKWKPVGSIGARIVHTGIPTVCGNTCQRTFYSLHHDLVNCYGVSVSQMISDVLPLT